MLGVIFLIGAGGCKSHKKDKGNSLPDDMVKVELGSPKSDMDRVVEEAMSWLGTPYAYGAAEKGKATDCSGLVMVVFDNVMSVKMPRNSAKQAEFCMELEDALVGAGDLVFFAIGGDKNKISHVGIMIDGEKFIHASASKGVIVSEMTTPYYQRHFKMYGRVPKE